MLNQQINEQLGLLQNELLRLKNVTDYIDGAKQNSLNIIAELESIQKNYTLYTDKLYNTYKQNIDDLKKSTVFLEKYAGIVELTDSLLRAINDIDLSKRLTQIENSTQELKSSIQALIEQNQKIISAHLEKQDKGLKLIKIIVFVIFVLSCTGVVLSAMSLFK